ncbi:uncharacterized protein TNCT_69701 [Trichonephila clavata]|uniref:Uncharacterized protein n=1 Tax=Trichonephila clavata TaxID=2740835 RepID=A0A8X6JHT5_TRICU|nr:uncharacterized protein TNCT_69701 [Trichonephila clavata]
MLYRFKIGTFSSALDSETRLSFASSEEVPSPPKFDSSRTIPTTKTPCLNCNEVERHKRKQSSSTRKKPIPNISKDPKHSPPPKNNTVEFPKKKKMKFSRKYDPTGKPEDGFMPVPGPYGAKTTPRSAQRRARIRSPEELIVKESRQSSNILGNGNFEIIRGGIFSDDESNEIGEGRRIGRNYDSYALPQFQQIPFNVPNFQFPSFYRQLQVPTHPMFFPRAAY